MIFKRRDKPSIWSRARGLLVPRKGWRRGFKYIGRRVQRLPDTPHRIALGFACGALASFTPFFTLHLFVAILFAWVVRGNIIASAFGTIVGNPISFPLIAAICMQVGNWILSRAGAPDYESKLSFTYAWENPVSFFEVVFTPYLIGGFGPGLLAAAVSYWLLRPLVAGFQKRRRELLSRRAREELSRRIGGPGPRGGRRDAGGRGEAKDGSSFARVDVEPDPKLGAARPGGFDATGPFRGGGLQRKVG